MKYKTIDVRALKNLKNSKDPNENLVFLFHSVRSEKFNLSEKLCELKRTMSLDEIISSENIKTLKNHIESLLQMQRYIIDICENAGIDLNKTFKVVEYNGTLQEVYSTKWKKDLENKKCNNIIINIVGIPDENIKKDISEEIRKSINDRPF